MPKGSIIFFAIFFIVFQSNAQITVGFEGGLGLSRQNFKMFNKDGDVNSDYDRKDKYITVPVLTVFADIPVSQTFSIRPGFGFRQQGYSYINYQTNLYHHLDGSFVVNTFSGRLNYLEFPLNISIKLPFYDKKFEVLTGATFGICLGGEGKHSIYTYSTGNLLFVNDPPLESTVEKEVKIEAGEYYINQYPENEFVSKYNWNLNFGLGYEISKHFNLNMMLNYGISNLCPYIHENDSIFREGSVYRYTYINSLSYSFTLAFKL